MMRGVSGGLQGAGETVRFGSRKELWFHKPPRQNDAGVWDGAVFHGIGTPDLLDALFRQCGSSGRSPPSRRSPSQSGAGRAPRSLRIEHGERFPHDAVLSRRRRVRPHCACLSAISLPSSPPSPSDEMTSWSDIGAR